MHLESLWRMGQIYLVRHGQASFGSANYDQLSLLGYEQARMLGEWFVRGNQIFKVAVTGSMVRHRQTAEACFGVLPEQIRLNVNWKTDVGFNEYDHHEVLTRYRPSFADPPEVIRFLAEHENGNRAFQQVFQEAMSRWMNGEHDGEYNETWPAFQARCVKALHNLVDTTDSSQNVIVFTSGGTIAALCQHVLALPDKKMADLNWSLVNCAITKLFHHENHFVLSYLNNFSHLELLGEKNMITYR